VGDLYENRKVEKMKRTAKLRELIQSKEILVAPGAFDALSAKLVEAVGFDAVYMTGFGTAASIFGVPDIGLLTMTEMVENAKRISDAVTIPVIADADTGYGNHLNVVRTVEEYEKAGVAGIHIEDQVSPKKCGHMEGKKLISIEDMVPKIRAAVASRKDKDLVLIARTDAIAAEGFDEAIRRGNTYKEEGADIIFVEAPTTIEQLENIPKLIKGPVMVNIAPKTPVLHFKRYEEMGYSVVIYPPLSLTACFVAVREKLMELKEKGILKEGAHGGVPFDEFLDFLGLKKYRDSEENFLREI
jgi:carboxyvinyl-carboxyphosphonate phosphorylmutase